jgi:hypothetical protein
LKQEYLGAPLLHAGLNSVKKQKICLIISELWRNKILIELNKMIIDEISGFFLMIFLEIFLIAYNTIYY